MEINKINYLWDSEFFENMCVHCIIPFGYLRKLFAFCILYFVRRCHKNSRTLHKHNDGNNEGVWGTWRSPVCLRALDFCLLFRYHLLFSCVFANRKKKKFLPGENFSEGFPETVCNLLRNLSFREDKTHKTRYCVIIHKSWDAVVSASAFVEDTDNRHGDHYWLLFVCVLILWVEIHFRVKSQENW